MTVTSTKSKSRTLRDAIVRTLLCAIPAMRASPRSRGLPMRRACARRWAALSAAGLSKGRMRSAYVETILVSRACKWSRRRPCGSSCTPYSNSCTTNDGSQRSSCSAKNAITPGCGTSRVISESTFVSRRNPLTQCLREGTESPDGNRGRVGFRGLRLAGRSLSATALGVCAAEPSRTRRRRARRHRDCGCRLCCGPSDSASRRISESRALASATVQTRRVSGPFKCKLLIRRYRLV